MRVIDTDSTGEREGGERERERVRQTDRGSERQRDRERQRDKETDRQRGGICIEIQTNIHTGK